MTEQVGPKEEWGSVLFVAEMKFVRDSAFGSLNIWAMRGWRSRSMADFVYVWEA